MLIERLLFDRAFATDAKSFASRHADFDPSAQREQMLHRANQLVESTSMALA